MMVDANTNMSSNHHHHSNNNSNGKRKHSSSDSTSTSNGSSSTSTSNNASGNSSSSESGTLCATCNQTLRPPKYRYSTLASYYKQLFPNSSAIEGDRVCGRCYGKCKQFIAESNNEICACCGSPLARTAAKYETYSNLLKVIFPRSPISQSGKICSKCYRKVAKSESNGTVNNIETAESAAAATAIPLTPTSSTATPSTSASPVKKSAQKKKRRQSPTTTTIENEQISKVVVKKPRLEKLTVNQKHVQQQQRQQLQQQTSSQQQHLQSYEATNNINHPVEVDLNSSNTSNYSDDGSDSMMISTKSSETQFKVLDEEPQPISSSAMSSADDLLTIILEYQNMHSDDTDLLSDTHYVATVHVPRDISHFSQLQDILETHVSQNFGLDVELLSVKRVVKDFFGCEVHESLNSCGNIELVDRDRLILTLVCNFV
jgi:hypothetical protein